MNKGLTITLAIFIAGLFLCLALTIKGLIRDLHHHTQEQAEQLR